MWGSELLHMVVRLGAMPAAQAIIATREEFKTMATVRLYQYNWSFPQGLPPNTNYYGYITWGSPPVLPLTGTVTITASPVGAGVSSGVKLAVLDTTVFGPGPGTSGVEFTMRNVGYSTIRSWTVYMSLVTP